MKIMPDRPYLWVNVAIAAICYFGILVHRLAVHPDFNPWPWVNVPLVLIFGFFLIVPILKAKGWVNALIFVAMSIALALVLWSIDPGAHSHSPGFVGSDFLP